MKLPGFTAETSIGPTTQAYRVQNIFGMAGSGFLTPQYLEADAAGDDSDEMADMDDDSDEMDDEGSVDNGDGEPDGEQM